MFGLFEKPQKALELRSDIVVEESEAELENSDGRFNTRLHQQLEQSKVDVGVARGPERLRLGGIVLYNELKRGQLLTGTARQMRRIEMLSVLDIIQAEDRRSPPFVFTVT